MADTPTSSRPDPDALLARLEAEAEQARRGKLKIFFGASPGVGKTYAMLAAAKTLQQQGVDLVVGIVETHGRSETAQLLQGLEVLPLKEIAYRGHQLKEFDLDAALARAPDLILVDELAHTNAAGSRHPKRWQDVSELLAAGIDVFTTVNVQHLESLNDVISRITGTRVWETVPDHLFDVAEEVVLVDLPPEELLDRLKAGKVYVPQQAERAMRNFFRKGNLLALRELALRRTADRVDDDVRAYRRDQSVVRVWPTRESLLALLGTDHDSNERLVRTAARLAGQLNVPWHALFVETPARQRLDEEDRARIIKCMRLSQELGGESANVPGQEPVGIAIRYAREHNLGKLLVSAAPTGAWRWPWQAGLSDTFARQAPDLDVMQVAASDEARTPRRSAAPHSRWQLPNRREVGQATLAVAIVTLLATPLRNILDLANIVMLFLLAVLFAAVKFGRGASVVAAFLSVAAFDFFFVQPRLSFAVSDVQYLLTFAVMLTVGLITAHQTTSLRFQVSVAQSREGRMRALYEMARELSASLTIEQIDEIARRFLHQSFSAEAFLLVPGLADRLPPPTSLPADFPLDLGIAQWTLDHAQPAGRSTDTLPSAPLLYLPLRAPMRTRGVIAMSLPETGQRSPEQERLLDTFCSLVAIAVERVHYIEVAQNALLSMESERLRNSLLSALSHDLRTPLTALVGLADALPLAGPRLPPSQEELAQAIREEALRTSALVHNLLDMARLQSGQVTLHKEWQPLEEVVGAALQARASVLHAHTVEVDLPASLPLLEFDATLLERVLCNLLENAAKYTPAGSRIAITARLLGAQVEVAVSDNGPGLPPGKEQQLFEKFTRGQEESAIPGVGLGLSIVRAIIEAHKGSIRAENCPEGGARFSFTLPVGTPPAMPPESV